jgi:non-ribosomal peptide synthetase component E (peptide arylation enzyme)
VQTPKQVRLLTALPVTALGKVDKHSMGGVTASQGNPARPWAGTSAET